MHSHRAVTAPIYTYIYMYINISHICISTTTCHAMVPSKLCSDRNQESGIPAGNLLRNGPCQVRFRNSRFQELPRGGTLARVLGSLLPSTLRGPVVTVGKKNSGANRDGAEERSVPCPHNPRNLWQIFNGIEQNEKMKCCGQKYWEFTPSKILEHFGLQSTRETAAKSLTGAIVSSSC